MSATIKDIAKRLNISVSTVSYALNGGPRSVPDRVRDQVLQTAQELNYRPNRNARSLITKRAQSIGVIPSELQINLSLGPYFLLALNGVINAAEALGQDVLLFTREDQRNADKLMNYLLDGRVDGVIFISPPTDSPTVAAMHQTGIPYLVIGNGPEEPAVGYHVDNFSGVQTALGHLYQLGHRRIGHITGRSDLHDGITREAAFRSFVRSNELEFDESLVVEGNFTIEGGFKAGLKILDHPRRPSAVFCSNDELALGLIHAARDMGIKVPGQLSVVGFDDSPASAYGFPPLTTVRQPISQMASEAMQDLVRSIDGKTTLRSRLFSPNIVVRASTSCPQEDTSTHES
jgi:LacI family transcriptional regulator/LacI family repressor for deo operon, udp, cdd, tsx, nupC, and nupG